MTRAIDRLIVSGSIDPTRTSDETTPIGWVLGRLDAEARSTSAGDGAGRDRARRRARALARRPSRPRQPAPSHRRAAGAKSGQLAFFDARRGRRRCRARSRPCRRSQRCRLRRCTEFGVSRSARSRSSTAARTATTRSVSSGMRRTDERLAAGGETGLAATEIGDAVHRLLEHVDLHAAAAADDLAASLRALVPEGERRGARANRALRRSPTATPSSLGASPRCRVRGRSGRSRSSTTACFCAAASTCSTSTASAALVLDYKTNSLAEGDARRDRRARLPAAAARLRARLLPRRCGEVEVVYHFLERPDAVVSTVFRASRSPSSRRSSPRRSQRSTRASSARRRASSSARAARRSTSSAPGPRSAGRATPNTHRYG